MEKNKLSDALCGIDEKYLTEFDNEISEKRVKNGMNKRIFALVACFAVVLVLGFGLYKGGFFRNNINIEGENSTTGTAESVTATNNESTTEKNSEMQTEPTTKENEVSGDEGGGVLGLLKYRLNYYDVPAPFVDIIGDEMYDVWYKSYVDGKEWNKGNTNVMIMKSYIQHFDISREDFDKANLKWAKIIVNGFYATPCMNPKDFINQELDEIYNGDIIYTFDDEIINAYYMGHKEEFYPYCYQGEFRQAVEKGEYTPRTEVWVDVDKMEAEIIEKYGSVD